MPGLEILFKILKAAGFLLYCEGRVLEESCCNEIQAVLKEHGPELLVPFMVDEAELFILSQTFSLST